MESKVGETSDTFADSTIKLAYSRSALL